MTKIKNAGMPQCIQKVLKKMGYILPPQFNPPSSKVYLSHYALIISFVLYAFLTIWDICCMQEIGWRAYILWVLSTLIITLTQLYKSKVGKYRVESDIRKLTHKKNRHHINKVSTVFLSQIYDKPLRCEIRFLIVIFFFYAIVLIQRGIGVEGITPFGYILQTLLIILSVWNCVMLCVENFAEFYGAKDFCIIREK